LLPGLFQYLVNWTMRESTLQNIEHKKDWALASGAFDQLLTWLDDGAESNGQRYLEMRQRLEAYFDRKNCSNPEELADETLNRVARRLQEEGDITGEIPARYCYIVARFVFMEHLRLTQKANVMLDEIKRQPANSYSTREEAENNHEIKEKMLNCLDRCTAKLEPVSRQIITKYYLGQERVKIENRRALAESLGISPNALSIRACRIRDRLEGCVRQCAEVK
jgi:DNA-directed RNA polymerase specialized sigma24 family protein